MSLKDRVIQHEKRITVLELQLQARLEEIVVPLIVDGEELSGIVIRACSTKRDT